MFAQTGPTTLRVGGIYDANALVGSFVVSDATFLSHFDNPQIAALLISGPSGLEGTFNTALTAYPDLNIRTRSQYEHDVQSSVNQLLGLIYVLLALAVLIALIGIVNTLMLSVFERTREIGLLRAVGMNRSQVRAMIRSESVIIALFGAVIGLVIGTALGVALAESLRHSGVSTISIPVASLVVFLILAALLGAAAAGGRHAAPRGSTCWPRSRPNDTAPTTRTESASWCGPCTPGRSSARVGAAAPRPARCR